jgi:hypothetical protein
MVSVSVERFHVVLGDWKVLYSIVAGNLAWCFLFVGSMSHNPSGDLYAPGLCPFVVFLYSYQNRLTLSGNFSQVSSLNVLIHEFMRDDGWS